MNSCLFLHPLYVAGEFELLALVDNQFRRTNLNLNTLGRQRETTLLSFPWPGLAQVLATQAVARDAMKVKGAIMPPGHAFGIFQN